MDIHVSIEGVEQLRQALDGAPERALREFEMAMEASVWRVEREARTRAPVDVGRLRASITHSVERHGRAVEGRVGSAVHYAPYQEYGTGLLAEGPGGKQRRHMPPGGALDVWARRHGWESGSDVAWAIFLQGGVKPKRYLREGLAASVGFIEQQFQAALERLVWWMGR